MTYNFDKRCICRTPDTCKHYKVDGICQTKGSKPPQFVYECDVEGCKNQKYRIGLCTSHFKLVGSGQSLLNLGAEVQRCIDKGCGRKVYKEGLCWTHFKDEKHENTPTRVNGGAWKGSLNMGLRLTEKRKEKARKGGNYGDTVNIPSFMLK